MRISKTTVVAAAFMLSAAALFSKQVMAEKAILQLKATPDSAAIANFEKNCPDAAKWLTGEAREKAIAMAAKTAGITFVGAKNQEKTVDGTVLAANAPAQAVDTPAQKAEAREEEAARTLEVAAPSETEGGKGGLKEKPPVSPEMKADLETLKGIYSQANSRETIEAMDSAGLSSLLENLEAISSPEARETQDWKDARKMITDEMGARAPIAKDAKMPERTSDAAGLAGQETIKQAVDDQEQAAATVIPEDIKTKDSLPEEKEMAALAQPVKVEKEAAKAIPTLVKREKPLHEPANTPVSQVAGIEAELAALVESARAGVLGTSNYSEDDAQLVRTDELASEINVGKLAELRQKFVEVTEKNYNEVKGNQAIMDRISGIADNMNALTPSSPKLNYPAYYDGGTWN